LSDFIYFVIGEDLAICAFFTDLFWYVPAFACTLSLNTVCGYEHFEAEMRRLNRGTSICAMG
jgi:hypothetical protein